MFYNFTSENVAESSEWPRLWCLETLLSGLFIEEKDSLKQLPDDALKKAIITFLFDDVNCSQLYGAQISLKDVGKYCEVELPFFRIYLHSVVEGEIPTIRTDLLLWCFEQSSDFKVFVTELKQRMNLIVK